MTKRRRRIFKEVFPMEVTPPSSLDDDQRKELLWESREEHIVSKWAEDCRERSEKHDTKSKEFKVKYRLIGLPSVLIPIILGGFSPLLPCHSLEYSLGLMSAGIFSGLVMFFNYGKKQVEHSTFSNKYFNLVTEIEGEMSKPRKHRIACDVYLEKTKNEYNSLVQSAPDL